jgi:DNA helicase-2/ATP-dependent DNA helicase PcrA
LSAPRVWFSYQQAIFDHVVSGTGHGVVIARAGSGKSTTIEEAVRRVPSGETVLVLAFGRDIAKAMADKLPRSAYCMTTHSFGKRLCESTFPELGGRDPVTTKVRMLLVERYGEPGRIGSSARINYPMAAAVQKGVSLAKNTLAVTPKEIDALIDDYDLTLRPNERAAFVEMVSALLVDCAACTHAIDYDDMIWFPIVHDMRPAGFDRVFVDETQDLNRCQIELCLRSIKAPTATDPGGRILAVGDDRQAIFAFRGADAQAVPRVVSSLSAVTMPLSVSYRCAQAVVRHAQRLVPDLEAAPGAPEGSVEHVRKHDLLRDVMPGDFVLSRSNAPLVEMTLSLLAAGRPAHMLGRDIGENLVKLLEKSKADTVEAMLSWVDDWAEKQAARLMRKGKDPEPPRDQAECLARIAEGEPTVASVIAKIRRLFDEDATDEERVTLSSTHKAKGLERDRVWLLRDTYLRRQTTEEENLLYVGITRAKRDLRLVSTRAA